MIKKHLYIEDLLLIQKALLSKGYSSDLQDCEDIWDEYSESEYASWITVPNDLDSIFVCVEEYLPK